MYEWKSNFYEEREKGQKDSVLEGIFYHYVVLNKSHLVPKKEKESFRKLRLKEANNLLTEIELILLESRIQIKLT